MSVAESDKTITARLRWLRPEQGGRREPPSGPKYSTVARFDETEEHWLRHAWSVVVDFTTPPGPTWTHIVSVRFLSNTGPAELQAPDRVFALYEGHRKVAEGLVLANPATQ